MKTCSPDCIPVCDLCKHYAFNGEPEQGTDGKVAMVYVGNGECKHPDHLGHRDPGDSCEDFYCTQAAKEDEDIDAQEKAMADVTEELTRLWVGEEDQTDTTRGTGPAQGYR